MKMAKKFCIISGIALAIGFLTLFFYGNINAQQSSDKDCSNACSTQRNVCFNINPDKMLCEKEYQTCLKACEKTVKPASTPVKESKKDAPLMY